MQSARIVADDRRASARVLALLAARAVSEGRDVDAVALLDGALALLRGQG